jgi:hypothetical protein
MTLSTRDRTEDRPAPESANVRHPASQTLLLPYIPGTDRAGHVLASEV